MRIRSAALALALLAGGLTVGASAAAGAAAPWPSGTVFVAESGQRYGVGNLWAVNPNGQRTMLGQGAAEDVVVNTAGVVYWADCDGDVSSYTPGVGARVLAGGFNCPDAIALAPDGDLLVGDFAHLYRVAADGSSRQLLVDGIAPNGIAADGYDNIYFVDGSGSLEVLPAGAPAAVRIAGLPYEGQYLSLRLSGRSDLVTALGAGKAVAAIPLTGVAPAVYGTGYVSEGAVLDRSGAVYSSDDANNPATRDQVDRLPHGGSLATIASQLDTPKGLAVFPPVLPAARATTSIALTSSVTGAVPSWKPVYLTARVSSAAGSSGGLVQFAVNGAPLGEAVSLRSGVARLGTPLPAGADHLTATYVGSQTRAPAASNGIDFSVSSTFTRTALTTTSPASVPDRTSVPVTATSTATHGIPGGSVRFFLDGKQVRDVPVDGTGAATTNIVVTGAHPTVRAVYLGDARYTTSASGTLAFTVTAPFVPTLSTTSTYGATLPDGSERVTVSLKVRGSAGYAAPTGAVTADNGFVCGTLAPVAGASVPTSSARCSRQAPAHFGQYVTLTYSGDATFLGGTAQTYVST